MLKRGLYRIIVIIVLILNFGVGAVLGVMFAPDPPAVSPDFVLGWIPSEIMLTDPSTSKYFVVDGGCLVIEDIITLYDQHPEIFDTVMEPATPVEKPAPSPGVRM